MNRRLFGSGSVLTGCISTFSAFAVKEATMPPSGTPFKNAFEIFSGVVRHLFFIMISSSSMKYQAFTTSYLYMIVSGILKNGTNTTACHDVKRLLIVLLPKAGCLRQSSW
jgi:hypothetical protein